MTTSSKWQSFSFGRVLAVFYRYFYGFRRAGIHISDLFYWPLIDILLWGLASTWLMNAHLNTNIPLVIMTAVIFWQITSRGSLDISVSLLVEFWHRNLVNFFSTPLRIGEWICGVLLFSMLKLLISVLFGTLCVYLLYSLNIYNIGWQFLPFASMLMIFGWTTGFIAASAILYWGRKVETLAFMFGMIFAPFSAVFYPVSILPPTVQIISWSLPTTYVFEGMRKILSHEPFPLSYFGMSLFLNIIYLTLTLLLFRFSLNQSKKKGLARLD